MMTYSYTLSTLDGKLKKGTLKALTKEQAGMYLRRDGWFILQLDEARNSTLFSGRKKTISRMELVDFTDHMASMIRSGTPILEALSVYKEEEGEKLTTILDDLSSDMSAGKSLSTALAYYPEIFSKLYIAFVKTGETTGKLDETLTYLAKILRRHHEFVERIKSALTYPAIVLSAALAVVTLLVLVVVPRVAEMTRSIAGDLPMFTKIVASGAEFLTQYGIVILGGFIFSIFLFVYALKNKKIKKYIDPYMLKVPLFGPLLRKYILARFLQVVGSCFKYGIPLILAFDTVTDVVDNSLYKASSRRIEEKIVRGMSLSEALSQEGAFLFPKSIVRTIRGAEKTGTIDEAMIRLSLYYEKQVDRSLKRITDLIEPALIVVMGLIVGAIAIAVIAPIYQLSTSIK